MWFWLLIGAGMAAAAAAVGVAIEVRRKHLGTWLGAYLRRDWAQAGEQPGVTKHLLFCFVDHFEPQYERPSYEVE